MTSTIACYHCQLPAGTDDFSAIVAGEMRAFCCPACQSVCETIHAAGLEGFYQKAADISSLVPPVPSTNITTETGQFDAYDSDVVQAEYLDIVSQNRTIVLLLEGIHCAACVWLIERAIGKLTGINKAQVNLTTKQLVVAWDNRQIALSRIMQTLLNIGYAAVPYDPDMAERLALNSNRRLLYRMAFAGFAAMNLMWVAIALYTGADNGEFGSWFQWISFAIATPTLFYAGFPFLKSAVLGVRQRHLTMDLPIAIGASVTYAYSTYILLLDNAQTAVYFDTVVNFLFVILVGRYLEAMSKREALSATRRLLALQPTFTTVVVQGEFVVKSIQEVEIGDTVLIRPGERVPVDGIVIEGKSAVNEAMLSGESLPLFKQIGDKVVAGSVNIEGALQVRTVQVLRNTALSKIVGLIETAQASKAPIQCTADRIVPWFVLTTLTLASLTFFLWLRTDMDTALLAAVSVLIITCPCALGLATPMAVAVATGVAAQRGILIRQGAALESLSEISHVVFDKTGTLTTGQLTVVAVHPLTDSEEDLLMLAAAVEQSSEHSIAAAIVSAAKARGIQTLPKIKNFKAFAGQGVQVEIAGALVQLGTQAWFATQDISLPANLAKQCRALEMKGISCVLVVNASQVVGAIGLADTVRPEAAATLAVLRSANISIHIISGDKLTVVRTLAHTADLGDVTIQAEVLPQDKVAAVKALQAQGARVMMVGDGVNDAPALVQADVGVALGSGTDVSIESADIVLNQSDLSKVVEAQALAHRTLQIIKQNIGLSITYNIIMVPLAMMALVSPLVAAITMPISSLLVIGNAARLRRLHK